MISAVDYAFLLIGVGVLRGGTYVRIQIKTDVILTFCKFTYPNIEKYCYNFRCFS